MIIRTSIKPIKFAIFQLVKLTKNKFLPKNLQKISLNPSYQRY